MTYLDLRLGHIVGQIAHDDLVAYDLLLLLLRWLLLVVLHWCIARVPSTRSTLLLGLSRLGLLHRGTTFLSRSASLLVRRHDVVERLVNVHTLFMAIASVR